MRSPVFGCCSRRYLASSVFALAGPMIRISLASLTAFIACAKKLLVEPDMTPVYRVGFRVKVPRAQVRMQSDLVWARQADVEYLGLRMVDPNDRMKVRRHVLSFLCSDQRPPG